MRSLRIVITVDPEIPVPPRFYGGIERIVHMLVNGLSARGHDVYLFAHPDSRMQASLVPYRGLRSGSLYDTIRNAAQIARFVYRLPAIDIVHSFSRLAYVAPLLLTRVPVVQSYQRHISSLSVRQGLFLSGGRLRFTACSQFCVDAVASAGGRWEVIPNGVPLSLFHMQEAVSAEAPLVFLGRIEYIKGAHIAIDVARRSGKRLIIAGNHASEGKEYVYFKEHIMPHCDGERIRYIGPVDDLQKNELLGKACALLFPVIWDEPFGIVMAESFACGTPVIALRRGAVPEVVRHGTTGFVCDTPDEMVAAVAAIPSISRSQCRLAAEDTFSDNAVVEKYSAFYNSMQGSS